MVADTGKQINGHPLEFLFAVGICVTINLI